ncbi:endo alpha-1,4 polygalactosaminidase [Methylobacterium tarhaniae]|uniref:endo alpha-1,4 polygalactosaminidase n=1 Tax=Methylobacterium tarhaniae TaxID=1187852 RepID=UPI003D012FD4
MKTGLYVLQGVDPAQVAAAPFDVKVVEIYDDNGRLFGSEQVRQMGGGPGGALLLGYFSIGEAENYRSYWSTIPKSAIGPVDPNWPGNYEVKYWTDEWKSVAKTEIDKMLAAGYDGAYFDVVDEFQLPWAERNAPGGDAAGAMKILIQDLSAYAKAKVPTFKIWVNGGEELLTDRRYLASIDGLFKENLFYDSDGSARRSTAATRTSLDYLKLAQTAGKDVIAIEYVSGAAAIADVQAKADAAGMGSYIARLDLKGVSLDGVRPGQVMHDDGLAQQPLAPSAPPATDPGADPNPVDGTSDDKPLAGIGGRFIAVLNGRAILRRSGGDAVTAAGIVGSGPPANQAAPDPAAVLLSVPKPPVPDGSSTGSTAPDAGDRIIGDARTDGLLAQPDGAALIRALQGAGMEADLTLLTGEDVFGMG